MLNTKRILFFALIAANVALTMLVLHFIGSSLFQSTACLVVFLMMTPWGHVIVYSFYYKKLKILEGFVWGTVLGVSIASLLISVIVYILGWSVPVIQFFIFALPSVILVCFLLKDKIYISLKTEIDQLSINICLVILMTMLCFYIFPYKNIGIFIDGNYLYAWLFGHDFINRLVHIESLSRGMPFEGMFFAGETLSYYWLAYILPAFLKNLNIITLENSQLLQISQLIYSLVLLAIICLFFKKYAENSRCFIISLALFFFCYSYAWLVKLYHFMHESISSIPDISTGSGFTGFSHGIYRFMLVEPQSVLGLGLMLMIFYHYEKYSHLYVNILIGLLIGLLFGIEATNGIMIMLWFCLTGLYYIFAQKENKVKVFISHFISGITALIIYAIMFSIEMYSFSSGKGVLQLSSNLFALKNGWIYFPVAYGPPFLIGVAGLFLILAKGVSRDHWVVHFLFLFVIGLFFALFIQNPTEYHFGLLKSTRIIPIAILMLSLYFIQTVSWSMIKKNLLFFLLVLSLPSYFTDNHIASDISNPSTFVRSEDMEAALWMRDNIPRDAIVQSEPNYPGIGRDQEWPQYAYSFIPIFAQRKTLIGEWKVSHQEHSRPEEVLGRFHSIRNMYSSTDINESIQIISKYNINYIYVGELERKIYGPGVDKFSNNSFFELVYAEGKSRIYKVLIDNFL